MKGTIDESSVFWHAIAHGVSQWPWWVWACMALFVFANAMPKPKRRRSSRGRYGGR